MQRGCAGTGGFADAALSGKHQDIFYWHRFSFLLRISAGRNCQSPSTPPWKGGRLRTAKEKEN
jgi:hypothetical protein